MCDKITLSQWVFAGQWVLLVDCESGKSAHAQHSSLCSKHSRLSRFVLKTGQAFSSYFYALGRGSFASISFLCASASSSTSDQV